MSDTNEENPHYFLYDCQARSIVTHPTAELMLQWICGLEGGRYILIRGWQMGKIEVQLKETSGELQDKEEEK